MSSSRSPRRPSLAAFALSALVFSAPALAQPSIRSFTIDCGGQVSTGGTLRLTSSIGQPDAAAPLSAGSLQLRGGFLIKHSCPADFDGNGTVDVVDLFGFLDAWFAAGAGNPCIAPPSGCPGDWNDNGTVGVDDLFLFLDAWFAGCQ